MNKATIYLYTCNNSNYRIPELTHLYIYIYLAVKIVINECGSPHDNSVDIDITVMYVLYKGHIFYIPLMYSKLIDFLTTTFCNDCRINIRCAC